jgi:hypothetical protein
LGRQGIIKKQIAILLTNSAAFILTKKWNKPMAVIAVLFTILSICLIALILFNYVAILRAKIPEVPHKLTTGKTSPLTATTIPYIIWTYWHELPQPNLVTLCQNNWREYAPDHAIYILHKNNILDWVSHEDIPSFFNDLPNYRQADWLRLKLLSLYGGVWIDASIILTQNLNWVHKVQQQEQSEYIGFYIDRFTNRHTQPIVENWFMAATANSKFISKLALEFNHAIEIGEQSYLNELKRSGKLEEIIQRLTPKMQTYLIMHVAASKVLTAEDDSYRLTLYRAEDTALAYHQLLDWRKSKLHIKLALTPCPKRLPFFVKLRGGERKYTDNLILKGLYFRGSFLAKFLKI